MGALQATTGEQLQKVVVPRICGSSILVEEDGATAPLTATTEARLGWAHPSHGQRQPH